MSICLGAVATSAPVFAKLNFMSYLDVVTASLQTSSPGKTCTDSIAVATEKIQSMVASDEGRKQLSKTFRYAFIEGCGCTSKVQEGGGDTDEKGHFTISV